MWIDKTASGNSWTKVAEQDFSSWGVPKSQDPDGITINKIASNPGIEFRCDCDQAVWSKFSVLEIKPPTG